MGLAAMTAAAACGAPALAARSRGSSDYDLSKPADFLRAYVAIRTRLDGERTFMPYSGTIFGKVEGKKAVPLFDVRGFSWATAKRTGPDLYQLTNTEAGHFCDLETGEPLRRWRNPLNGLDCDVKHYRSSQFMEVSPSGLKPLGVPPGAGTELTRSWGKPTVIDNMVWVHEDLIGSFRNRPVESFTDPLEYFGPQLTATSLATWSTRLDDLRRGGDGFIPASLAYQTMGNWRPFMRMGCSERRSRRPIACPPRYAMRSWQSIPIF